LGAKVSNTAAGKDMEVPRLSTEIYPRVVWTKSASVLGLRPMIVGRLSKTSSGFNPVGLFAQAALIARSPDMLTNLFRRGAA
jgi:hypothetical protein